MAAPWEIYPQFEGKVWHVESVDSTLAYRGVFDSSVQPAYLYGRIKCFTAPWGERDPNNFVEVTDPAEIEKGSFYNAIFLMDQHHYDPVNDVMDSLSTSPHRGYFYRVSTPINFSELSDTSNVVVWSGFNYRCNTYIDSLKYLKVSKNARSLSTLLYDQVYHTVDSTTPLEKSQIFQIWFDTFDTRGIVNENDPRYVIESRAGSAGFGYMWERFSGSNLDSSYVYDLSLWCADNQPTTPDDWPPLKPMNMIEPTWGGCPENPLYPSFKFDLSKIGDGMLFAATGPDKKTYKVTGAQFKGLIDPTKPWDDWNGGVWHIINGPEILSLQDAWPEGPFKAWDVTGANEREITGILPNEELVFVTPPDTEDLFDYNLNSTWDFGEYTDTSGVTTFKGLLSSCQEFNGKLGGNWDTSNVTSLYRTFYNAQRFNQEIDRWNTSKVESMEETFSYCKDFNQPLNSWDVSNVSDMYNLFMQCENFNRPLNNWQVGNVKNMYGTLSQCKEFNGDVTTWDMRNVTKTEMMFFGSGKFNQDIGGWNVMNVENMSYMFGSATSFNQDLSDWCVTKLRDEWRYDGFDAGAGFEGDEDKLPCWGHCPRGENGVVDPCDSGSDSVVYHVTNITAGPDGSDRVSATGGDEVYRLVGDNKTLIHTFTRDAYTPPTQEELDRLEEIYNTHGEEAFINAYDATYDNFVLEPGHEYLVTGPLARFSSSLGQWEFGPLSDTALKTDWRAFLSITSYDAPLDNLDFAGLNQCDLMFNNAVYFNQSVSAIDTSNCTTLIGMFMGAYSFNQPVNHLVKSNITSIKSLFKYSKNLNQPLNQWDTSNVIDMRAALYECDLLNQDVSMWNTANVEYFDEYGEDTIFGYCNEFDQDLSEWCVSKVTNKPMNWGVATPMSQQIEKHPVWGTCPRGEDQL